MMRTVRPVTRRSTALCTSRSDTASSALVASSRIRMGESLMRARAMAMRCRWPPDSRLPRSPTLVWYPSGSSIMKSCALASLAACSTSSLLHRPYRPYAMLSSIVPAKSTGS
mmetsp:Transcript_9713/g.29257  ORF Transcript_9713/g.29257 Transcript_9713/m.29257 type:complete len:112 (-) Transcript_9713:1991-2326(-)